MYGLDTSHQAWATLATKYASQSKSRVSQPKWQLQSLQQGSKTCTKYLNVAKQCADELFAVGKPVEDEDLISFVVSGQNPLFNTFVTIHSFVARDNEMSFADFQSELLSHEIMLENQQHKTFTPETGSFALHTNKQRPSNFNQQNSTNFRKPSFPPRINPHNQQFAAKNSTGYLPRGNNCYLAPTNLDSLGTPAKATLVIHPIMIKLLSLLAKSMARVIIVLFTATTRWIMPTKAGTLQLNLQP
jgi:hypothetical protein